MTGAIQVIDSHAHLSEMAGAEQKIRLAILNGIVRIVAVGMDTASNEQTLALAKIFPETVRPALGYHPWMIGGEDDEEAIGFIDRHLDQCVAIGEIGLDYKIKVKKDRQKAVFKQLLRLALAADKPAIVHSRYSETRTFEMVTEQKLRKAVFHWYSGPLDLLDRIISNGYYISATPALAYSHAHRAAIAHAPVHRILIETDAPVEYAGVSSEPMSLFTTLRHLCEIKGLSLTEGARITRENAEQFFAVRPF